MARGPQRKGNNKRRNNRAQAPMKKREEVKELTYSSAMSVGELADKLNRNASEIIKLLFMMGTIQLWMRKILN